MKSDTSIAPIELCTKICAGLGLLTIMPLAIQAFGVSERKPEIFQYSVNWFIVVVVLALLFGAALVYNFAVWIGFGRSDGKSWLQRSTGFRSSFTKIALVIAVLWLVVGLLIDFMTKKSLLNINFLQEYLVVFAVSCSLSILGLKSSEPKDEPDLLEIIIGKISGKNVIFPAFILLALLIIYEAISYGLFWQGMSGDQTLEVYIAQTLATGTGPYEKYIIMHPPFAYLPSAGSMLLGRIFNLQDLISVRLSSVIIIIFAAWLTYKAALDFTSRRSAAFFSAASMGWQIVLLTTTYVSQTKLIVILLSLLMIRSIQKDKWLFTGVIMIFLTLSWGGAFVYFPIPFFVLLLSNLPDKKKKFVMLIIGLAIASLVFGIYLGITNTTDLFIKQYIGGLFQIVISKISPMNSEIRDVGSDQITLFDRLARLPFSDIPTFILGLFAFGVYIYSEFPRQINWQNRMNALQIFENQKRSPVVIAAIIITCLTVVDMQSIVDLLPLVPLFSILAGWLLFTLFSDQSGNAFGSNHSFKFLFIFILFFGIQTLRLINPMPVYRTTLRSQILVAEWINQFVDEDASIQILGDLSPLVLDRRENLTRVIHLGPKTTIALQSENIDLNSFAEYLVTESPTLILVDQRNSQQEYLAEFFQVLNSNYDFVENAYARGGYARIYYGGGVDIPVLLSIGTEYASESPDMFLAELDFFDGDFSSADEGYKNILQENRSLINLLLIQRARIRLEQGKDKPAIELMMNAATRGKYQVWGLLALANYYKDQGEFKVYNDYLENVFPENPPLAFQYQLPGLFSLSGVMDLDPLEYIPVDSSHWIISHQLENVGDGQALLTLWWWLPDRSAESQGEVIVEWVNSSGEVIGDSQTFSTFFYPEAGVQWGYLLAAPQYEGQLYLRVGLQTEKNEYSYSTPIPLRLEDE